MSTVDLEAKIVKRTFAYLGIRDLCLAALIAAYASVYYRAPSPAGAISAGAAIAAGALWVISLARLMTTVRRGLRDEYLSEAFKDEYFVNARMKAGHTAFHASIAAAAAVMAAAVLLRAFGVGYDLPLELAGGLILLAGVSVYDLKMTRSLRG